MLSLFVNTFTSNGKYAILKRHNLTQSIQKPLSSKSKNFFEFFCLVLKPRLNIEHFQENVESHSECISDIMDSQREGQISI